VTDAEFIKLLLGAGIGNVALVVGIWALVTRRLITWGEYSEALKRESDWRTIALERLGITEEAISTTGRAIRLINETK